MIDDDEEIVEDFTLPQSKKAQRKERRNCIMGHLASPITEYDCEFLLSTPKEIFKGCRRHRRLRDKIDKLGDVTLIREATNDPMTLIQDWVKEENCSMKKRLLILKNSVENIVIHKMNFQRPIWISDNIYKEVLYAKLRKTVNEVRMILDQLKDPLHDMIKAESVKDNICFKSIVEGDCRNYRGLMAEPDICILQRSPMGHVIFSTNLMLCALDKLQGRFNMLLYAKLADMKMKYEGVSMYDATVRLISKFEEIRPKCGNDFFDITNTYEPLILGWTVADEQDLGCKDLFINSYNDIKEVLDKHGIEEGFILEVLPENRSEHTVRMYIELSGIVKCFGYPILDAETTLSQVIEYGLKDNYAIDLDLMDKLEGLARRDICVNYYRKNNRLPVITECPIELRNLMRGRLPPVRMNKEYDLWRRVKFGKTLNYDYSPDQSDLIKDSAAAVNTSAWANMYDPCAFRAHYGKPPPPKEECLFKTRILLEFLASSPDKVRELIEDRDNGILSYENHICVLCQKECEINQKGRSFTKQTPEQRLIQVSMEHNIADQIFPLLPEQSMIDSEIKNIRRHLNQVKGMQASSQFINLDLKKWCLHQRHSSNEYLGRIYDELFGMKTLFKNSHLFFNGCSIFPNHRLIPPDYDGEGKPIESSRFTRLFIGGMEGMQQKKWTHGAITLIKYVLELCDIKGEIMGQGDNQVILLQFSQSDINANAKRESFLNSLEMHFRRIGHKLKTKETWYSKHLHEYSKQRMYKGSAVSYAMKKCTKVMPDINDGLFSIPSSLSTINTITESIARADYDPDIAFIMNGINIANYLHRKKILDDNSSPDEILYYLNWPIDFGGINVSPYHSHTVRGNDDKITIWISVLETMKEVNPCLYEMCVRKWVMSPSYKPTDALGRKNLYEDIHSLNIKPPPSAESKIKDLVKDFLTGPEVTNEAIRVLYDTDHSATYNDVIEDIDKIRPVFPSLGHELLSNSNAGLFIRLQGKLTNSKTLEKIVNEREEIPHIDMIRKMNMELIHYLKRRTREDRSGVNSLLLGDKIECVSRTADNLRKESWDVDIIGVTKPSWSHQCIIKKMDECSEEEKRRGITVRVSGEAQDRPMLCQKIYGPMKPFVGSTTKEKISKKSTLAIQDRSSWSRSTAKLGKVKSWLKRIGDDESIKFCDKLINEKKTLISGADENWDEIEEGLLSSVGGNLFHRFKSSIDRDTAMVNCLPSVTGHFDYSSNSMKQLTAGGKDYNVFYQYIYTACTESLAMMARDTGEFSPMYMILFPDCDCFKETPNPKLTMTEGSTYTEGLEPPRTDKKMIIHERNPHELKKIVSVILGQHVSKNIDQNYRLSHQQGDITVSSTEYKKEHISINDMRLLDFKTFLISCFVFSSHCRELFMCEDKMLIRISEDRSFLYLAELILEADLVPTLIEFVGQKTNTHSGICSIFGISSYISRNMPLIMMNILTKPNELYLVRFFEDSFSMWLNFFRFLSRAGKVDNRIMDRKTSGKIYENLNGSCNLGKMVHDSGLFIDYETDERDNLLAAWKLSDRGEDINVHIRQVSIGTKLLNTDRYPLAEINTYHMSRSNSRFGMLKVPQLSFLARPLGAISSGGNKALETLIATGLYWKLTQEDGQLYCLAEGSGSILAVLGLAFPQLKIVYNTWMRQDICGRDKPTDTCVPAWVDLKQGTDRMIEPNLLITGETDITHPNFLIKALGMMSKYPPTLVTMDAESEISTNNLHFLELTILPIARRHKSMFLVKLFHMCDLTGKVQEIMGDLKEKYTWVLYKPISSNPVGCEIYLVIVPKGSETSEFRDCQKIQMHYKDYIGNNMNMNPVNTDMYVKIAKEVSGLLRDIFPTGQLDIPHTYKSLEGKPFCNLLCPKFLGHHMEMIDTQHLSENNLAAHLATRSKGINNVLYQLCHDLVFLFLYHTYHKNLFLKFYNMSTCKVNKDIESCRRRGEGYISRTKPGDGDMWGTWTDARMFLREYGKIVEPCRCSPVQKEWTWDLISKFNPTNSLSWQVFSCLEKHKLVHWNTYFSYRVERKNMAVSTEKSRMCNETITIVPEEHYVELEESDAYYDDDWDYNY